MCVCVCVCVMTSIQTNHYTSAVSYLPQTECKLLNFSCGQILYLDVGFDAFSGHVPRARNVERARDFSRLAARGSHDRLPLFFGSILTKTTQ